MGEKIVIRTENKDVICSWAYTWSRQPNMSIDEQRILLRVLEFAHAEITGTLIKNNMRQMEHGLWDVKFTIPVSDVIFSNKKHKDVVAALDALSARFFTYEDEEEWWKCGFIEAPVYKKGSGIIKFKVDNNLWNVFLNFKKGYREFELNKALALRSQYSIRFYMLMSRQKKELDMTIENFRKWLGIAPEDYKDKNGNDRVDNMEKRIIQPAKAELDVSCPYTFTYSKYRVNDRNPKSKVLGFKFYPVYQPKYRDEDLEKKSLQMQVSPSWNLSREVLDYLKSSIGFTTDEIKRNIDLWKEAQQKLPDLIEILAILKGKSREKDNPKGWIIQAVKGKLNDL